MDKYYKNKEIKSLAEDLGLKHLTNLPFKKGHYTVEKFVDGQNVTQIFSSGVSMEDVLEMVEWALVNNKALNSGGSGVARQMRGIGEDPQGDYEIRLLQPFEKFETTSGPRYFVELTVGKSS